MGMDYEYKGFYAKPCDEDCKECGGEQTILMFYQGYIEKIACPLLEKRADEGFKKSLNIDLFNRPDCNYLRIKNV